jgi:hypothetical protein
MAATVESGRSIERRFAFAQVQVVAVEITRICQLFPITDGDSPAGLPGD